MRFRVPILVLWACVLAPGRADTWRIRAYTVAEGLAHDHVSRIYRDSQDFLWICTDEGLSRFDGRRFVNYSIAEGLPHIHVNDIIETRGGDYWVATDGGLTLFQPAHPTRKFVTFKPDGPPKVVFVNAVLEEPDGAVLAGTEEGLYRLRRNGGGANFERIDFGPPDVPGGPNPNVHTLYIDGNGILWLGASSGLYRCGPGGKWSRFGKREGLPYDFVGRIKADANGRIWVCTRQGLARLAARIEAGAPVVDLVLTDKNGLPHRDVRAIYFAPDGRRWIATLGGLVVWDPNAPPASAFHVYSSSDGVTDPQIYAIEADVDGNLWAGSRRGGLMRLVRPEFEAYDESHGLAFSGDDEIVETRSGGICVAATSDPRRTIRCFGGGRFHLTVPALPPEAIGTSRQAAIVDHLGNWWMSGLRGLFRFRSALAAAPDLRLSLTIESRRLYEDSQGDLWITTVSEGVFGLMRWERTTSRLHDLSGHIPEVVRQRGITAIVEAPLGQMWFGLGRPGGLLRWHDERFEDIAGAPAGTIEALYRDRSGRVWMASSESGLGRIDQPADAVPAVRVYNRSHGLASNEVWSLTEDRQGRIYAGTARGIDRLDSETGRITHYTQANGLSGDIRAAHCDRNGDLWFLSNRGLFRLRRGTDAPRRVLPVKIMNIRVAGAPHAISELGEVQAMPATFEWRRNSVQIEFSAINFQAPDQVRYQFELRGGAEGWSDPSPASTVHFSNLASGHYEFLVRAINAEGLPSAAPASFAFTIEPPLWRRWWFVTILAGVLMGLPYLWYRFRLNRQLALERVRSHIATDLHDDIGASLSRIAVVSEVVKERVTAADGDSRRMLADVAETSRALVDGMSDIVWSIDPRRDHLADVVARLRAFGSDVLEPCGIRWACEDNSGDARQELSPDQRRQFYLIFKEAIHNIARHSSAANVVLRIAVRDNHLCGEIEDDGCGIPSGPRAGLGLDSMRARASRLGGRLEIQSRQEGGTRVTLRFPLKTRNA